MSDNKQKTSVEQFAIALYEGGYLQGNGDEIQKLLEKYKSIENSIFFYWFHKGKNHNDESKTFEQYYEQTYGGDDE
jgi:hypothetical protein